MPVIKIFPNSRANEFATEDDLTMWLLTSLKARNGEYRLKSTNWIADLPSGSVVLFRFGFHLIVGEAVVIKTAHIDDEEYPASVWFAASSIRVYAPPIPIETLQQIIGGTKVKDISSAANAYAKFDDWSIYPKMLSAHVGSGGHFM